MSGMKLFDNYEEDGQLSLFSADYDDWDEDWEEVPEESAGNAEEDGESNNLEDATKPERVDGMEEAKVGKTKAGNGAKANSAAQAKASKAGDTTEAKTDSIGTAVDIYEKAVAGLEMTGSGPTVRVKYCASCGKLLFVREETAGFHSECNNCGIKYFQKLS